MERLHPEAQGWLEASTNSSSERNCSLAVANCSELPARSTDVAPTSDLTYRVTVAILLGVIILCAIVGNVFVVLAVIKEKVLHKTLANRLIGSLAVTDLLVAVLLMPVTAVTLITVVWPFGRLMCDFFVFIDVLFCTASILHLVAIAIDRYWTVTDVEYAQKVGKRQSLVFFAMVALAWGVAACVCIPPLFEWGTEYSEGVCRISQDRSYTVYSTTLAFYLPLLVIIAIYGKIFFLVRRRVRERLLSKRQFSETYSAAADGKTAHPNGDRSPPTAAQLERPPDFPRRVDAPSENYEVTVNGPTIEAKRYTPKKKKPNGMDSSVRKLMTSPLITRAPGGNGMASGGGGGGGLENSTRRWQKVAVKRERRALRTLLIITGIFVMCWLPFFVFAALVPFCEGCQVPKTVLDLVNWLGYCNSALNPIVYTIFSPDFRKAFRRILLGQYRCDV